MIKSLLSRERVKNEILRLSLCSPAAATVVQTVRFVILLTRTHIVDNYLRVYIPPQRFDYIIYLKTLLRSLNLQKNTEYKYQRFRMNHTRLINKILFSIFNFRTYIM